MSFRPIYYLTNTRLPTERAHGIQIMNVCSALAKVGIKVTLLVPRRFNSLKQDPFLYYGLEKNFVIKRLPTIDLFKLEKILGPFVFWLQLISFYMSCYGYLLFKNRRAILYVRDYAGVFLKLGGWSVVYECHNIPQRAKKTFFRLLKWFRQIVVINSLLKNLLIQHGLAENRILVAPDGVDLQRFSLDLSKEKARLKLRLSQEQKIVLYLGHFYKWKGVITLLEAASLVQGATFYLIGGFKEDKEKLAAKKKDLVASGKVVLLEHQLYSSVPLWLKAADVLVLPNSAQEDISRLYTSPLKMFEYMASNRPIIAAKLPSFAEILSDKNCLWFQADNSQDLASKIEELLGQEKLGQSLAQQARLDVQQYSWERRVKKILAFIN